MLDWPLQRYHALRDFWEQRPPPHVSIRVVAAALGVDWDKLTSATPVAQAPPKALPAPVEGPSVAEVAKMLPEGGNLAHSTLAASKAAIRALIPQADGS